MGKQRRKRTTFHASPAKKNNDQQLPTKTTTVDSVDSLNTTPINFTVPDNLFANVNINFADVKRSLNEDTQSVKSFKSVKSDNSTPDKALSKKDKLKLRKQFLLQKIDTLNQKKKEAKLRNKRRKMPVIGDTNPLLDALPSLESLINNNSKEDKEASAPKITKGIQKATKRKKESLKNIQIYKMISKNKKFNANPMQAITQHIRAVVEDEQMKLQLQKSDKK